MFRLKPQNSMIRPTMSLTSASLGHNAARRVLLRSLTGTRPATSSGPRRELGRKNAEHLARGRSANLGESREGALGLFLGTSSHVIANAHRHHRLSQLDAGRAIPLARLFQQGAKA